MQRTMAKVMAQKGLTRAQIAKRLGVSERTVTRMMGFKDDEIAGTVAARLNDALPDRIAGILDRIAAELEVRDLSGAPLHHLSLLFGTLFDKMRLAKGQSTNNVSVLAKVQAMAEAEEARRLSGAADAKPVAGQLPPADDQVGDE